MDKSQEAANIFNKYARHYQEKYMSMELYSAFLDEFCDLIPFHGEVLELGCGPGNITQYLLQKRPDLNIAGIDLAPAMIELAKVNNPTASFQVMDVRDIHLLKTQYHGVIMGFCTPYLSKIESEKLIDDASDLLLPNGTLYLSTMEGDYSKSGFQVPSDGGSDQIYIHYHEAGYLVKKLEQNGFKDIRVYRQDFPVETGPKITDLVVVAVQ